jgi:hypothetical protein
MRSVAQEYIERGIKLGIAIAQGKKVGRQAVNIEIAKGLLSEGCEIGLISRVSKLSKKLIEELAKE